MRERTLQTANDWILYYVERLEENWRSQDNMEWLADQIIALDNGSPLPCPGGPTQAPVRIPGGAKLVLG